MSFRRSALNAIRGFLAVLWRLFCVWLLTGFLGLIVVRNDYYEGSGGAGDQLWLIFLFGAMASLWIILRPVFRSSKDNQPPTAP